MKRNGIIKIVLAFVGLCTLLFTSCTGDRLSKRIIVWHSMRPVERKLLNRFLHQFAGKYPDWRFEELFYAPEQARTNFIVAALGGSGPDLIWGASDNIGPFVELKVIQPLEEFFPDTLLSKFLTEPIPANTWFRGHLYQVADRVGNHLCLVYNRDKIKTPPRSFSELISLGDSLAFDQDGDGRLDHFVLAWNYTEPFFAVPFIGGFGGWIMDENGSPMLNTRAVVKAARFIYDLAHRYKVIPEECDYETANALFMDGYAAMIINGPWSWATYLNHNMRIGVARIPKIDETGLWPTPMVSPLGYSLNVNTAGEKRKIALELLKFLTSPEVEITFARISAALPSRREALEDSIVQRNELLHSALDQMKVGRIMPVVTELRWIWDAMRPGYQAIFTGSLSPEQAAVEMQKLAEKLIKENRAR